MAFRGVATAALIAAALSSAGGQEPRRLAEVEAVPLELASALAGAGGFGGEPQILVGAMPEWASNRLVIPAGGALVGSAFLGSTVIAVVRAPGEADSAVVNLKKQLLQRGWQNPPPPPVYGGGGFRPATIQAQAVVDASKATLCGDQQMLIISGSHRRLGGSEITYRLISTTNYSVCRPQQPPAQSFHSPYPTLYNPPNVNEAYMANGCSSNYSGSGTTTTYRSSLTLEAILDHYGKQLVDSGWTAGGSIAGRTWTKKDSTGAPLELSIVIAPSGQDGSCQRLDLQVKTFRKP
jgi:hypothetical protein